MASEGRWESSVIIGRTTCPACQRTDIALNKDGTLRSHNDPKLKEPRLPYGTRCWAGGYKPATAQHIKARREREQR